MGISNLINSPVAMVLVYYKTKKITEKTIIHSIVAIVTINALDNAKGLLLYLWIWILVVIATCARKPKVPGSSPAASHVQR